MGLPWDELWPVAVEYRFPGSVNFSERNTLFYVFTVYHRPQICYTTTSGFHCFFGSFQSIFELFCGKFYKPSMWGYVSHTNDAFSWDNLRTKSILDKWIDFALAITIALKFRIFVRSNFHQLMHLNKCGDPFNCGKAFKCEPAPARRKRSRVIVNSIRN